MLYNFQNIRGGEIHPGDQEEQGAGEWVIIPVKGRSNHLLMACTAVRTVDGKNNNNNINVDDNDNRLMGDYPHERLS